MGQWVKCSERMPTAFVRVLIRYAPFGTHQNEAWRDPREDAWFGDGGYLLRNPSEWYDDAPPEPPGEEQHVLAMHGLVVKRFELTGGVIDAYPAWARNAKWPAGEIAIHNATVTIELEAARPDRPSHE